MALLGGSVCGAMGVFVVLWRMSLVGMCVSHAAFAGALVALWLGAPPLAGGLAASLGGDTDTIAAILGAMLGACLGMQCWPDAMIEQVKQVNGLDLQPLVLGLLKLR